METGLYDADDKLEGTPQSAYLSHAVSLSANSRYANTNRHRNLPKFNQPLSDPYSTRFQTFAKNPPTTASFILFATDRRGRSVSML